jgi:hypothetical protein
MAGPGPVYNPITGPAMAQGLCQVSSLQASPLELQPSQFETAAQQLENGNAINVDGASGALDFNCATGEAPSDYAVWTVNGGTFTQVGLVAPQDGGF